MKKGFTLIEVLVVVAVIAILAIAVVVTLNPPELLRQARDVSRISDMGTINKAVSLYYADAMNNPSTLFMGTSSVVYISIPDPTAPAPAGNQCTGLGLPALPTGYSYHCAASSTYIKTDGTGWIPINFSSYGSGTIGSVISKLPVDPINTTSTNLYYTYETDGIGGFKTAAFLESQKDAPLMVSDTGNDAELYEKGSNLSLASGRGLIGYWPLDEGNGTTTTDFSGSNGTGTWSGTTAGTSGYYSLGKVGSWSGTFNGSNDAVNGSLPSFTPTQITMTAWVYIQGNPSSGSPAWAAVINTGAQLFSVYQTTMDYWPDTNNYMMTYTKNFLGGWNFIGATWNYQTETGALYVNGQQVQTGANAAPQERSNSSFTLGSFSGVYFNGLIDEARIYDRALSATEIQEMYNAEK